MKIKFPILSLLCADLFWAPKINKSTSEPAIRKLVCVFFFFLLLLWFSWWNRSNEAQNSKGVFSAVEVLPGEVWWVSLSWEASPLAFLRKKETKRKKREKRTAHRVSLQHRRVWGVGFDGSQLQRTEWSAWAMLLVLVLLKRWCVAPGSSGGSQRETRRLRSSLSLQPAAGMNGTQVCPRWKRCWVVLLRPSDGAAE